MRSLKITACKALVTQHATVWSYRRIINEWSNAILHLSNRQISDDKKGKNKVYIVLQ